MGRILVVSGPPGAGKSTVAAALVDCFEPSALIEGDAFFDFVARSWVAPWLPDSRAQNDVVVSAAAAATGRFAAGGYTTVYDGVVGPWSLDAFATASEAGDLHYVVLLPDVERCVARVQARHGHGFRDEAATRKMHHEFAAATVDGRHVVVDPPDAPGAVVDEVLARFERGSLAYGSSPRSAGAIGALAVPTT